MEDVVINSPSGAVPYVLNISVLPLSLIHISNRVQKAADRLDGNTGKLCDLF